MAADALMSNATADTVGSGVSLRVIGTRTPPARMAIQIAIIGQAKVQIQGRLAKEAPWANIAEPCDRSCILNLDPIWAVRAVSSDTGANSSVSVWAAWGI